MEIEDLSWNEVTAKRFNNPLLPRSIRRTFVYSEKVFFSPNIEYLKKPSKKIYRKIV